MSIESIIANGVAQAVNELYGAQIDPESVVIQSVKKEVEGNFAVVVFPYVKIARKAPEAVCQNGP